MTTTTQCDGCDGPAEDADGYYWPHPEVEGWALCDACYLGTTWADAEVTR